MGLLLKEANCGGEFPRTRQGPFEGGISMDMAVVHTTRIEARFFTTTDDFQVPTKHGPQSGQQITPHCGHAVLSHWRATTSALIRRYL